MPDNKVTTNKYVEEHYRTFSGADIDVYAIVPYHGNSDGYGFRRFANLSTFSYSVYRDKQAVTPVGYTFPKGFTRGPRIIAGTMVFTVFDKSAFLEIVGLQHNIEHTDGIISAPTLVDQLPPIDIYVFMSNEHGTAAHMMLFGLEFMNEGQIHSIEDLFTENTLNYVARYISPMEPTKKRMSQLSQEDIPNFHTKITKHDIEKARQDIKQHRRIYW